jgi:type II secretion system protein J
VSATSRQLHRNRHRRPLAPSHGFTLLELTLALAMVAIMAASLYASMRVAFRAQSSAETAIEPSRTAELAFEIIRTDLQNVLPPTPYTNAPVVLAGAFQASDGKDDRGLDGDDVTFYTTADAPDRPSANGDVKKVELLITTQNATTPNGAADHVLVRRVTRNLLAQVEPTPEEEVICRNVGGFNVRYYDGTDWQTTWDSTQLSDVLPSAVEVTLELQRPAAAGQPPRVYRFVRVFALSCAAPVQDTGL